MRQFLCIGIIGLVFTNCNNKAPIEVFPQLMEIPDGFPPVQFPEDNTFTLARWNLGKQLFFDKALSKDSSVSCASCHLPAFAFSDTTAFSQGSFQRAGTSNSPTLSNIAYHPYYTRAGGVATLEMQVAIPVQEHAEFDMDMVELAQRLAFNPYYQQMAQMCYKRAFDPFVLTRALATFERSLLSGDSEYDRSVQHPSGNALSVSAKNGRDLFFSNRTNCSSCHSGFNFTNYQFENNGLYLNYADSGRMRLTKLEHDRGRFKVPSLRNVALTAPYMHDGSFSTLEEVVHHYNSGGVDFPTKSPLVRPLYLSTEEEQALVAFLNTLTDHNFVTNPNFLP